MESPVAATKGSRKRKHPRSATRSGTQIRDKPARVKGRSKISGGPSGSKPASRNMQESIHVLEGNNAQPDGRNSDSSESEVDTGSAAHPFEEAEDDALQQNAIGGATEDQSTTAANGPARRGGDANDAAVNGDFVDRVHSSVQEQLDNSEREVQRLHEHNKQLQERLDQALKDLGGEESLDLAHELYKSKCEVERLQNANKQLEERHDILSKRDAEKWAKYELVDPKVELQHLQTRYTLLQQELDLTKRRANHESKQGWTTTAENEFRLMNRNFKQLQWNLDRSKAQHRQEASFADRLVGIISGEGVDSEVYRQANIDFPQHFPDKGKAKSNLFFPAPENVVSQDALEPWFRTKARVPRKAEHPSGDGEHEALVCFCKRPESFGDLVGCDGECEQWFHYRCVGFTESKSSKKWFCKECLKSKAKGADSGDDEEADQEEAEHEQDGEEEYEEGDDENDEDYDDSV